MPFLLPLFLLFFVWAPLPAQPEPVCLSDYLYPHTAHYAQLKQARAALNGRYAAHSEQGQTKTLYRIEVVVHVLYRNEAENLPDDFIMGQITHLSRDFRALNPDSYDVRPLFADRIGDAGIEFLLNDVIRKPIDIPFEQEYGGLPLYDAAKVDSLGGSSPVDPARFLNIWILNIPPANIFGSESKVYGYATLPDSLQHYPAYLGSILAQNSYIPGVMVDVATISDGAPRYDPSSERTFTGRILTHEVGHYLGLLHTFDSFIDIISSNACAGADGLSDTPPQASPGDGCGAPNTCTGEGIDEPDMIENHMDYSDDACRVAFTEQQIAVMRSVLENERSGLLDAMVTTRAPQEAQAAPIRIVPNPVSDYFAVNLESGWERAWVYNAFGQLVCILDAHASAFSAAGWPAGWYTMRIFGESNRYLGAQTLIKN
jgi:YD repeat-containing protein